MKTTAELAIVGGGIMGLSIAYHLAKKKHTDVVVLESSYVASGASGRNGGGVRAQWSSARNVRLMQESIALCRNFARELKVNIWLRQGGYLFLARNQADLVRLEKNAALQNQLGLKTRLLSTSEANQVVPELRLDAYAGAAYNPDDGIVFPWSFLWGYAARASELGVEFRTHEPVLSIERGDGYLLRTTKGTLRAKRIVNAAGAWSPRIARMVGLELPNHPVRHEIFSSEPLKPFLQPMVSVIGTGLYFSQSMRGEIVSGITVPGHASCTVEDSMKSSLAFLEHVGPALVSLCPRFADVKVLRAWAGPYDETEDGNPIVGAPEAMPDFFLCCGFSGHGFMMAPVIGKRYAELLTGGGRDELFDKWPLERFARGQLDREDFSIG